MLLNWICLYSKWELFFYRIHICLHNFAGTVKNQVNFAKNDIKWKKSRIFYLFSPNSSMIKLYSFIMEMKVVRNIILNNIDINGQPSRMHRSSSRSRQKILKFEKIQKKDKSDQRKYFTFDHRMFWSKPKLSEMVF